MRKLNLESLQVESFGTTAAAPPARGTVEGHADPGTGGGTGASFCALCGWTNDWRCQTNDPVACGNTNHIDCTHTCSEHNSCDICW